MASPRELTPAGPPIDPSRELWAASVRSRDFGPEGIIIEADVGTKAEVVVVDMLRAQLEAGEIYQPEYDLFMDEDNYDWDISLDAGPFAVDIPGARPRGVPPRGGNLRERLMPPG